MSGLFFAQSTHSLSSTVSKVPGTLLGCLGAAISWAYWYIFGFGPPISYLFLCALFFAVLPSFVATASFTCYSTLCLYCNVNELYLANHTDKINTNREDLRSGTNQPTQPSLYRKDQDNQSSLLDGIHTSHIQGVGIKPPSSTESPITLARSLRHPSFIIARSLIILARSCLKRCLIIA